VFQDPTLYPWRRVWDNVALGLEAQGLLKTHGSKVDAALEKVGLSQFTRAYPRQLSGGMAQRAALARALVNEPRLLILDEPLGKLDSLTRLTMQKELIDLWQRQGYTALLVTHDVEEALLLANRVIVFSDRPATIKKEFIIERPYPRHRDDPYLVDLRRQILEFDHDRYRPIHHDRCPDGCAAVLGYAASPGIPQTVKALSSYESVL
jgi:NitT/TauT family transport system ATP-binding protein